jgi:hypothetical protein
MDGEATHSPVNAYFAFFNAANASPQPVKLTSVRVMWNRGAFFSMMCGSAAHHTKKSHLSRTFIKLGLLLG